MTWRLFPIGVFPWVMIAVSTVFFAPDWPRTAAPPRLGATPGTARAVSSEHGHADTRVPKLLVIGGVVWITLQVLVPLRHWVVPGDYRWTNEGYRFAWVVLLTEKGGDVSVPRPRAATGRRWIETGAGSLHARRSGG